MIRVGTRTLSHLSADETATATFIADGDAVSVEVAKVTASLFEMLGVPPLQGRTFRFEDEKAGNASTIVAVTD